MTRREHLALLVGTGFRPVPANSLFDDILEGFLRNARATSPSYAVCDLPQGTKLKTCLARSGKTYIGVARMLPALASCGRAELDPVLVAIFRNAFDPKHPDYWEEPPRDKANQRQVEASLVAWSLWRLGDRFLQKLSSTERTNIQRWLASCTVVPERKHNHAWFSAINQAARLALSERWKEFSGDQQWMLEDLKALDSMATSGDGWYSDSLELPVFDYYNFWTFASHALQWNQIIGRRYPELARRFTGRVKLFLEKTPYFFAADGSHPLLGRSLIYRWALLTPLVAGYQQGLWPHSVGLLRRIVRRSLEFHNGLGCYDRELGKLRETYSAAGTPDLREFYVDNGHPYWCMQSYSFLALPHDDPFWSAPEELLPIERADFTVPFAGPRMLLAGNKDSGQVRWLQSRNCYVNIRYRDKYIKFSYSSHFPFNILKQEDRCPWDATLVFRNPKTLHVAGRAGVTRGGLLPDGTEVQWWAELDGLKLDVTSRIRIHGEFEERRHTILAPAAALAAGIEILEGSYSLGIDKGEEFERERKAGWQSIRSRKSGHLIVTWMLDGYQSLNVDQTFEETGRRNVNAIYSTVAVNTLRRRLDAPRIALASLHYASPKPIARSELFHRAGEISK